MAEKDNQVDTMDIPTGGTRWKYSVKFATGVVTITCVLLLVVLWTDVPVAKFDQIKWLLMFATTAVGGSLGIYTASENGVKSSYAKLNSRPVRG